MTILRLMKSDFIKMKRTPFYLIHIVIPVLGMLIFLGYYSISPFGAIGKINGYLDAVSLAFPILIGVISSMVIQQEAVAGKFKEMLSAEYGKGMCLLSKVLCVLVMGFFSLSLAIGGFFVGFQYILKQNVLPFKFYVNLTLIIFVAEIFIYLFHLWLSIKFGSGASIGMGIFESLFSALIITGLGDVIWQWIPCAWSIRFCNNFFIKAPNSIDVFNELADFNTGLCKSTIGFRNCIIFTMILGILLGIWFNFFEGRGDNE